MKNPQNPHYTGNVTGQPSGAAPCKVLTGSLRGNTLAIISDQKVPARTLPNFAKSDISHHHGDGPNGNSLPIASTSTRYSDIDLGPRRTFAEVLSSSLSRPVV